MMELDPVYLSERESNNENQNPIIQTRRLSDYKIILAPKPIQPPTKREDRDAQRCRRAGMVPGAIRKYLLQKKKHEEEEEEDEDPTTSDVDDGNEDDDGEETVRDTDNVEDEDEIQVIGIRDLHQHSVLGEVNSEHEMITNGPTRDLDNDQEDNNNDHNKKRTYSESLCLSPDTTTPEVTESSFVRMSPHLEIHSSPVIIELEQSPGKRMRMETTPKNKGPGRHRGRVGGPSRKSNSEASTSNIDLQSFRRQILQDPPVIHCTRAPEDPELEKKVRKNEWKTAIPKLELNLENNLIPLPHHVGDLIQKAILGLGTRVAKDIPAAALKFFSSLVTKYPVSGGDETTEYYSRTFTQTSADSCKMSEFLFDVLNRVQADAQARVESKPFPFFKILTKMVVQQYKEYGATDVKLRRPFFVQFLEEHDRILSYNFYCKKLVNFTFRLKDYPEEFRTVMRWVGLLSYHLKKHSPLDDDFKALVNDFVDTLSKLEHSPSTCNVVHAICDHALGAAVSFKILKNRIKFESVRDNSVQPSDEDIATYLLSLSKSDMITGLKGDFDKERRHSADYPTLPISTLVNVNGRKSETPAVNLKGESYLHKLCKKVSHDSKDNSGLKLNNCLRHKQFDTVNPTDHFGNTPLHDAIAHGRFDAVTKFYEHCSKVDLPHELRVNLLAQNEVGDTPLHLAAVSPESENMSRLLLLIADNLQVREEALKTLNHQGKMPYELAFNGSARSLLKPQLLTEWNFQLGDALVHPSSRSLLQSLDTKKLILFWSEFLKQEQ